MPVLLVIYLVILSVYDIKSQTVPSVLLVVGGVCVMGWTVKDCMQWQVSDISDILMSTLPGVFMSVLAGISGKVGSADGIVLMIAGIVLGFTGIIMVFAWSLLLTAAVGAFLLVLRKAGRKDTLPYLPFLTVPVFIWVFS